jgi:hypothetical protein
VSKAGIFTLAKNASADQRCTDTTSKSEDEPDIAIDSTVNSLYFEVETEELRAIQQKTDGT